MVHLAIANGRTYFTDNTYDVSLFYENQDPNQAVLKGVSFKIYEGWLAKILTLLGFASEFQANIQGTEEKQTIYVNKNSFAKYLARSYAVYKGGWLPPKEYVESLLNNYPIYFDPKIEDIERFVRKNFTLYKKSREAYKDINVFLDGMIGVIKRREDFIEKREALASPNNQ
ncbi:hypothetical protein [Parachlamydia sp. AcF125]|uniref:hypothetical protein n=1 Tax=Parachlamydia sp. AcF125 TaxID=2795736 RepID=UPI001BC9107B|nr:hypothetical protein [Parachlamydia sp. AcF125]MBS4168465.1 hypothetical protein [Parachlamydia sp. AcF125]